MVWVVAAWEAVVSAAAGLVEEAMAMAMAATEVHRLVGAGVVAERVETSALGEVVTVAVVQVVEASGEGVLEEVGKGEVVRVAAVWAVEVTEVAVLAADWPVREGQEGEVVVTVGAAARLLAAAEEAVMKALAAHWVEGAMVEVVLEAAVLVVAAAVAAEQAAAAQAAVESVAAETVMDRSGVDGRAAAGWVAEEWAVVVRAVVAVAAVVTVREMKVEGAKEVEEMVVERWAAASAAESAAAVVRKGWQRWVRRQIRWRWWIWRRQWWWRHGYRSYRGVDLDFGATHVLLPVLRGRSQGIRAE